MTTPLTDVDEYTSPVPVPTNGEGADAALALRPGYQALANRMHYARQRVEGLALSYTRLCGLTPIYITGGNQFIFDWVNGPGGDAAGWKQNNTGVSLIGFPLPLPKGDSVAELASVKIYFRPIGGGATHAGLPGQQPQLQIFRQPTDGTTLQQVGTTSTLAAGSVAAYEAPQSLTVSPAGGHVISNGDSYYARFAGESGANALVGLLVTRLEYVMTPL
jgi:hypothetical protein